MTALWNLLIISSPILIMGLAVLVDDLIKRQYN
jgi:hypothetical protein